MAGVRHHVALPLVGTDGMADNGYSRAKVAQGKLIEASGAPCTIIRSTEFLEFLGGIADSSAHGETVRLSPVLFQPIVADDVAAIVAEVEIAPPRNGMVEIVGPERAPFNEIIAGYLKAVDDPREVVSDPRPNTSAAASRSARWCHWAGRASVASVSTNGAAAHRQEPDPPSDDRRRCSMKRILCSLLVVTLPFGSVLAARIACQRLKAEDCEALENREPLRRAGALAVALS